jgi:hypothetical protein
MIRYDLRCSQAHEFDGWFKDSAAFDKLASNGLLECPVCGGAKVSKRLMTPAVRKAPGVKGRPETPADRRPAAPPPAASPPATVAARPPAPAQVVAVLQRLRAEVEKHCDYVGRDFAEEARKIHRGESERAGIYGEATDAEAEALEAEGIEVARMPWVPRADG